MKEMWPVNEKVENDKKIFSTMKFEIKLWRKMSNGTRGFTEWKVKFSWIAFLLTKYRLILHPKSVPSDYRCQYVEHTVFFLMVFVEFNEFGKLFSMLLFDSMQCFCGHEDQISQNLSDAIRWIYAWSLNVFGWFVSMRRIVKLSSAAWWWFRCRWISNLGPIFLV